MTDSTPPIPGDPSPDDSVPCDIRALDAGAVLTDVVLQRRAASRAEARILALAVHYVDLHPVTDEHASARVHGEQPLESGVEQPLAGPGTPGIAEHAVEELGGILGVSYGSALQLVSDSVEICYRLPRLWKRVHDGRLLAWQARIVARATTTLSGEAVDFVDRQVTLLVDRKRPPNQGAVRDLVHEAKCRIDPDHEKAVEEMALADRKVSFDHQTSTASAATSEMHATLDSADALALDAALGEIAWTLRDLGDTGTLDQRRADALGMMANPQRLLDLTTTDEPAASDGDSVDGDGDVTTEATGTTTGTTTGDVDGDDDEDAAGESAAPTATRPMGRDPWGSGSRINLFVHASLADLILAFGSGPCATCGAHTSSNGDTSKTSAVGAAGEAGGVALIEKLGPMLLGNIRDWLTRTDKIIIRPVIDPSDPDSDAIRPVDRHHPPPAMREWVILRDGHCVFPGCPVDARSCDQDHIDPYLDPAHGGPPGQTHPGNLACLCRRHHRLKTFTAWDYQRAPDGAYIWTRPGGEQLTAYASPRRGSG